MSGIVVRMNCAAVLNVVLPIRFATAHQIPRYEDNTQDAGAREGESYRHADYQKNYKGGWRSRYPSLFSVNGLVSLAARAGKTGFPRLYELRDRAA